MTSSTLDYTWDDADFSWDAPQAENSWDNTFRRARGVISDVRLSSDTLDDASFMQTLSAGSPPGYGAFKQFVEGDYTFQDAVVRVTLEASNEDRGKVGDLKLFVDVPDVNDSGSAMISSGDVSGLYIPFNRTFHIVPKVQITLISGSVVSIPSVIATTSGFTVTLRNPTTGANTSGVFTWQATGY